MAFDQTPKKVKLHIGLENVLNCKRLFEAQCQILGNENGPACRVGVPARAQHIVQCFTKNGTDKNVKSICTNETIFAQNFGVVLEVIFRCFI